MCKYVIECKSAVDNKDRNLVSVNNVTDCLKFILFASGLNDHIKIAFAWYIKKRNCMKHIKSKRGFPVWFIKCFRVIWIFCDSKFTAITGDNYDSNTVRLRQKSWMFVNNHDAVDVPGMAIFCDVWEITGIRLSDFTEIIFFISSATAEIRVSGIFEIVVVDETLYGIHTDGCR